MNFTVRLEIEGVTAYVNLDAKKLRRKIGCDTILADGVRIDLPGRIVCISNGKLPAPRGVYCPRCGSWRVEQVGMRQWSCRACGKRWSRKLKHQLPVIPKKFRQRFAEGKFNPKLYGRVTITSTTRKKKNV